MKRESELIEVIVACERMLADLNRDLGLQETRTNPTIAHNVDFAGKAVAQSIERLAEKDLKRAWAFIDVGLLRLRFAREAFEAERIEALLGEADFLELCPQWQKEAREKIDELRQAIDRIDGRGERGSKSSKGNS
ncbi:MAG: hypothetical protein JSS83_07880 [Cyanobacteria bacterium SZAS LIN-3]|nr:hypothetical protein [Cyanobacteria bacterium SZAS LIN-3]